MKGRILVINTGSTSTKIAYFDAGERLFEQNISHNLEELAQYKSVMDQEEMRLDAIMNFLSSKGIALELIDLVMARCGLIVPMKTGVYEVTESMKEALRFKPQGVHACNLAGLLADDVARKVNTQRLKISKENPEVKEWDRECKAYIADAPMADEMIDEVKIGGIPEFSKRTLFHALNSRAMVRRYAKSQGLSNKDLTVIVAHLGGGSSVSLHHKGYVIDTNDSLGGDGPISAERAGSVPAFPLIEMCFSGEYTKEEIKNKLVGRGGAVAYFGTNDFRKIIKMAIEGDTNAELFLRAYCVSFARFIGAAATIVEGKVDAIIITGGIAHSEYVTNEIARKVQFIAPVIVYPGEDELGSLAENGYGVLSGDFEVKTYQS